MTILKIERVYILSVVVVYQKGLQYLVGDYMSCASWAEYSALARLLRALAALCSTLARIDSCRAASSAALRLRAFGTPKAAKVLLISLSRFRGISKLM